MSHLFSPVGLAGLSLKNRLVVAPMCQYSADDGSMTDWHLLHLGTLANSGADLLIVEATAVERRGRITHGCTGLYSDANELAMAKVIAACRTYGQAKLGIQLGHAGRKASAKRPWEGKTMSEPLAHDPWPTRGPSAIPAGAGWHVPESMTDADLAEVKAAFVASAHRAARIGFDLIEVHAAHGYLLHQFLSPLSNKRTDRYGGSLENRMRYPLEIFEAVRALWPRPKPLGIRISATDWVDGGWDLASSIAFAKAVQAIGCDFIDVSSGGTDPTAKIPIAPGYQLPFAEAIKRETGMVTMGVGMITEAEQAEAALTSGKADMISIARGFLDDPHWGWHAAIKLGATPALPPQYQRVGIKAWAPANRHATKS